MARKCTMTMMYNDVIAAMAVAICLLHIYLLPQVRNVVMTGGLHLNWLNRTKNNLLYNQSYLLFNGVLAHSSTLGDKSDKRNTDKTDSHCSAMTF